jgi:hypothetical protein
MKKTIAKLVGLFLITGFVFTSCNEDDEVQSQPTASIDPNNFRGTIESGETVLNAGVVYKLTGKLQINNGAILTIPAGTKIEATGGTSAYIAVAQGGKLNVKGTAANPVIMTSGLATKKAGDWGGVVICGKAPINTTTGGTGTAQSEVGDLAYGGSVANDNSGSITYLRIEYAGAAFSSSKEFNGVSLFGVGSGTVFQNVEAYAGADDGFEFFGGTVNTSNLISIGNEDDQFDWTEGWNGTNTNWYGKISFGKGNRGIEADNLEANFTNTPISNPTITGITLIGPGSTADATSYPENNAFKLRRGTKGVFSNVVLSAWKQGFSVDNDETIAFIPAMLKASDVYFISDVATKTKGALTPVAPATSGASADVSAIIANESTTATGAGNGTGVPTWATSWSIGL